MRIQTTILIVVFSLVISSCAKTDTDVSACLTGHIYGFWEGLWHGIIAPAGLLYSLFDEHVHMYAPNNNGGWYALGFSSGSGGWGFMANKGNSRKQTA